MFYMNDHTTIKFFELIGRPGAGKTTIINALANQDVSTGSLQEQVVANTERFQGRIYLALRYPIWAFFIYGAALGASGDGLGPIRKAHNIHLLAVEVEKHSQNLPHLVDEGIIHRLSGILYGTKLSKVSTFCIRQIAKRLAQNGVGWIYLDTPVDECVNNFRRKRSGSRFTIKTHESEVEAFLKSDVYDTLVELVRSGANDRFYVAQDIQDVYAVLQSVMGYD